VIQKIQAITPKEKSRWDTHIHTHTHHCIHRNTYT